MVIKINEKALKTYFSSKNMDIDSKNQFENCIGFESKNPLHSASNKTLKTNQRECDNWYCNNK